MTPSIIKATSLHHIVHSRVELDQFREGLNCVGLHQGQIESDEFISLLPQYHSLLVNAHLLISPSLSLPLLFIYNIYLHL